MKGVFSDAWLDGVGLGMDSDWNTSSMFYYDIDYDSRIPTGEELDEKIATIEAEIYGKPYGDAVRLIGELRKYMRTIDSRDGQHHADVFNAIGEIMERNDIGEDIWAEDDSLSEEERLDVVSYYNKHLTNKDD